MYIEHESRQDRAVLVAERDGESLYATKYGFILSTGHEALVPTVRKLTDAKQMSQYAAAAWCTKHGATMVYDARV